MMEMLQRSLEETYTSVDQTIWYFMTAHVIVATLWWLEHYLSRNLRTVTSTKQVRSRNRTDKREEELRGD